MPAWFGPEDAGWLDRHAGSDGYAWHFLDGSSDQARFRAAGPASYYSPDARGGEAVCRTPVRNEAGAPGVLGLGAETIGEGAVRVYIARCSVHSGCVKKKSPRRREVSKSQTSQTRLVRLLRRGTPEVSSLVSLTPL